MRPMALFVASLPYSITLILVTLLYWFNLYLPLYSVYPTPDCVFSISMFDPSSMSLLQC